MSQPRLSLDVLHVPSPCTVPWKSMTGTERVRHCSQCAKDVYNISAMTSDEASALLESTGQSPCVRFYRRFDGTIVTTDRCGNRVMRTWQRFTAIAASMFIGLSSLVGCDRFGCTQGKMTPPAGSPTSKTTTSTSTTAKVDEQNK